MSSEFTLNTLCDALNIKERRLERIFHEYCGKSCWKYVTETRLDAAKRLLETALYPVGTVGAMCGFSDPYYFSRFFNSLYLIGSGSCNAVKYTLYLWIHFLLTPSHTFDLPYYQILLLCELIFSKIVLTRSVSCSLKIRTKAINTTKIRIISTVPIPRSSCHNAFILFIIFPPFSGYLIC